MTIPANKQQAASPWGAEVVYLCYGPEGGPFTIVDTGTPLPVSATVTFPGSLAVTQSGTWTVQQGGAPWSVNISGTTSSDTPKKRIMLPANGGANMPATGQGIAFANGIAIRITTGPGDGDAGAASTNDVLVNLDYA